MQGVYRRWLRDDGARRGAASWLSRSRSAAVQEFLYREARLLDAQKWASGSISTATDAVFWVPAVTMDGAPHDRSGELS